MAVPGHVEKDETVHLHLLLEGVAGLQKVPVWWGRRSCFPTVYIIKGGRLQFKSATPQYCGQPNRLRSCGLKKLRNCDCGPSNFDFRNSAIIRSLLPILLLSGTFSSAQDGFKNQPKIFLELSVSLKIKKTCLKGTVARDFLPPILYS